MGRVNVYASMDIIQHLTVCSSLKIHGSTDSKSDTAMEAFLLYTHVLLPKYDSTIYSETYIWVVCNLYLS